ncbi:GNAT family N-acetyltransferase [Autumnicola edwardsiae]|uniref:GNAT family N-acetyltransferase n=1 Tax=Autumnicola edwardsiae TaxID=3075594 RepID=A0ABU3CTJ6_9FLAO|nr:GNAT family N-acetyltransferase [Zunongwangia sp. F297]MDT0649636.1 GNAT family N-acetyltransferase [Zunongwangia sp. F297]
MLEFREIDYARDIPEIADLLLTSLSDTNNKEHFIWKHIKNPFGKSYGLLACDEGKIVGVRMFMFWEFARDGKVVKAIRPVDTITHPEYRGKGIFKKLTLDGLEKCRDRYDLIFNTPNNNSFPGYLKMGWQKSKGRLSYRFAVVFPLLSSKSYSLETVKTEELDVKALFPSPKWTTNYTKEYLRWRYAAAVYKKASFKYKQSSGYIIYKIKKVKGVKILLLIDYIGRQESLQEVIRGLAAKNNTCLIHYLDNNKMLALRPVISFKRQESVVVYKEDQKEITSHILFSSGDLEGRL